jgi:hypothetical protein
LIGDVLDKKSITDLARIGLRHIDHNESVVPRQGVVALGELILLSTSDKDLQHSIHADPPRFIPATARHSSGAKLVPIGYNEQPPSRPNREVLERGSIAIAIPGRDLGSRR